MDRRRFMLAAAALVAGCGRNRDDVVAVTSSPAPLGVQLYSVRDLMEQDVFATLELVAAVGYREVEFAGYFDHEPAELKAHLDRLGLAALAAHVGYDSLADDVDRVIGDALEMGHDFLVVPWTDEQQRSLDDYRRHAENFNRWGEACTKAGVQFAYHNHEFEWFDVEGQVPYDVLLEETDPGLVKMELDLAWALKANADPVAYFQAWPGRFPMLHLKDLDADGNEADIGDGSVDFQRILENAELAGLRHGFIERDEPSDSAEAIAQNFAAMMPIWASYMAAIRAG